MEKNMKKSLLSILTLAVLSGCASTGDEEVIKDEVALTNEVETGITLDDEGFITDEVAILTISEESYLEEMDDILTEDGHTMRIDEVTPSDRIAVIEENTVYFSFDSSKITPEMQKIIDTQLSFLKKYPKIKVILEGHTDERGSNAYNVVLGEKRAKEVEEILLKSGISKSQIEIISYGEMKPSDSSSNKEAWKKNRRVVFIYK
jgi:peptidoglycan-associated lipoprotein